MGQCEREARRAWARFSSKRCLVRGIKSAARTELANSACPVRRICPIACFSTYAPPQTTSVITCSCSAQYEVNNCLLPFCLVVSVHGVFVDLRDTIRQQSKALDDTE